LKWSPCTIYFFSKYVVVTSACRESLYSKTIIMHTLMSTEHYNIIIILYVQKPLRVESRLFIQSPLRARNSVKNNVFQYIGSKGSVRPIKLSPHPNGCCWLFSNCCSWAKTHSVLQHRYFYHVKQIPISKRGGTCFYSRGFLPFNFITRHDYNANSYYFNTYDLLG